VETAQEMHDAVLATLPQADALIMAAAVADYRPAQVAAHKIKKVGQIGNLSYLELERTPDILAAVSARREQLPLLQVVVGFAAETEDLIENARRKLQSKCLDLIVANDARQAMGAAESQVVLLGRDGSVEELPLLPKEQVAEEIIDRVISLLSS